VPGLPNAGGAPCSGTPSDSHGNLQVQQPEPLLESDPVVAELFRLAPVLVAGDVWPLLAAEMPVEGLVVHEGRPLTPNGGLPWAGGPLGGGPEIVEPAPTPVGVPTAGPVAFGLAAFNAGLPGVAALAVGVVVTAAPPVAPPAAPPVWAASAKQLLLRSVTVSSRVNRCLI
jgi:hypothetical protein